MVSVTKGGDRSLAILKMSATASIQFMFANTVCVHEYSQCTLCLNTAGNDSKELVPTFSDVSGLVRAMLACRVTLVIPLVPLWKFDWPQ